MSIDSMNYQYVGYFGFKIPEIYLELLLRLLKIFIAQRHSLTFLCKSASDKIDMTQIIMS